jgi:hypothetical protein
MALRFGTSAALATPLRQLADRLVPRERGEGRHHICASGGE